MTAGGVAAASMAACHVTAAGVAAGRVAAGFVSIGERVALADGVRAFGVTADHVAVHTIKVVQGEAAGPAVVRAGVEGVDAAGERALEVRVVHAAGLGPRVGTHRVGVASSLIFLCM